MAFEESIINHYRRIFLKKRRIRRENLKQLARIPVLHFSEELCFYVHLAGFSTLNADVFPNLTL
jgi:hypothetical protein